MHQEVETMRKLLIAIAIAAAFPTAASADELSDLKAQLEAAKKMIEQLEQRVQTLEAAKPAAPPAPTAAATPAPAPSAAGGIVIAPNVKPDEGAKEPDKARLEVYGFAQMDAIQDFNRVDPAWNATLRPTRIPVNCPGGVANDAGCGKDGESIFSVRQSRLGVLGFLPTSYGELKTKFEFDMFGVGADAGQTTIRLRHAYGELGRFLIGQTNSLFMDGDVFPNTIDYWGPAGMVFFRNVQARYTPWQANGMKVAVALEGPGVSLDNSSTGFATVSGHNKLPDLTGQFRWEQPWGHFQAAGIVRSLGFETTAAVGANPSGSKTGYGLNLSGTYKTFGKDKILAQLVVGRGIANYMNDAKIDLATDAAGNPEAMPLLGWLVYYDHYWNDQWSSSLGWSETRESNTDGQAFNAFHKGSYGSVNLLWYPVRNVMTGVELLYGSRENKDGVSGSDTRLQFSAKYNF
jgi:hypothetical protein